MQIMLNLTRIFQLCRSLVLQNTDKKFAERRKISWNIRLLKYTGCYSFRLFIYFFFNITEKLGKESYRVTYGFHRVIHLGNDLLAGSDNYLSPFPEWCRCFVSGLTQWRITDARGLMDCVYSTKTHARTRAHALSTAVPRSLGDSYDLLVIRRVK